MSTKWHSKVRFPKDSNYILCCTEESFGPSKSSGNPMITLSFEIRSPEEVQIDGESYNIAGQKVSPLYLTTQSSVNGEVDVEKTKKAAARLETMYKAFGLPFDSKTFNVENPTLGFKGKLIYAAMYGDANERRKDPTPEQLKNGQLGDVMKNPVTGEPLVSYYPKIEEIFGLAPSTSAPY